MRIQTKVRIGKAKLDAKLMFAIPNYIKGGIVPFPKNFNIINNQMKSDV